MCIAKYFSDRIELLFDLSRERKKHKNTMDAFVDADKPVAAREEGMSFAELHRRAYAGEFPPSRPMSLQDLI